MIQLNHVLAPVPFSRLVSGSRDGMPAALGERVDRGSGEWTGTGLVLAGRRLHVGLVSLLSWTFPWKRSVGFALR